MSMIFKLEVISCSHHVHNVVDIDIRSILCIIIEEGILRELKVCSRSKDLTVFTVDRTSFDCEVILKRVLLQVKYNL